MQIGVRAHLNGIAWSSEFRTVVQRLVYSTNQNAQIRVTWRGQNIFTIIRLPILLMNTHEKEALWSQYFLWPQWHHVSFYTSSNKIIAGLQILFEASIELEIGASPVPTSSSWLTTGQWTWKSKQDLLARPYNKSERIWQRPQHQKPFTCFNFLTPNLIT